MHNWNFKMLFYFGTPLVSKRDEQSLINFITPYALNMLLGGGEEREAEEEEGVKVEEEEEGKER